jgi:23S rRNA pseudouridine1911/1915/1917 synthase
VVHPGHGNWTGTLVNALIAHCGDSLAGIGGERRPGIVHRLDKDTSGVMVVAKTDQAHRGLAEQFAAHGRDGRLVRAYIAVVWGKPPRRIGVIDAAVGRKAGNRTKMDVVPGGAEKPGRGRRAVTRYEVLETFPPGEARAAPAWSNACSKPAAPIRSGSTWPISAIRCSAMPPMAQASRPRPARLARAQARWGARAPGPACRRDRFCPSRHGERMRFEVPPPPDFAELLAALRVNGGQAADPTWIIVKMC